MLWAALGDPRTWSCVLGHVAVCPSPGHLDLPLSYPERVGWPKLCLSADAGPDQPVSADWAPLRATSSWASPWPVSVLGRPGWRDVRSSQALGAPRTVPTAALLAPTASPPGAEQGSLPEPSRAALRRHPVPPLRSGVLGLRLQHVTQGGGRLCTPQDAGRPRDPPDPPAALGSRAVCPSVSSAA